MTLIAGLHKEPGGSVQTDDRDVDAPLALWLRRGVRRRHGLTIVHFSAQRRRFWWDKKYLRDVQGVFKAGVEGVFRRLGDVLSVSETTQDKWMSVSPWLQGPWQVPAQDPPAAVRPATGRPRCGQ
jgi:hypothetical protein